MNKKFSIQLLAIAFKTWSILQFFLLISNDCEAQSIHDFLLVGQKCEVKYWHEYFNVQKKAIIDSIIRMPTNSSNRMRWETDSILNVNICIQNLNYTVGYFTGLGFWQCNSPFILDKKTKYLYRFQPNLLVGIKQEYIYKNVDTTISKTPPFEIIPPKMVETFTLFPERKNPFNLELYRQFGYTISVYDSIFTLHSGIRVDKYYKIGRINLMSYYTICGADEYCNEGTLVLKDIDEFPFYQNLISEIYKQLSTQSKKSKNKKREVIDKSHFQVYELFKNRTAKITFINN